MKVDFYKIKIYSIIAVKMLGVVVGCVIFWLITIEFMWACYYAGIPM